MARHIARVVDGPERLKNNKNMNQQLAEKFELAAKITRGNMEWESRAPLHSGGFGEWETGRNLSCSIAHGYEIRITPIPLQQDPHGRPLHNPDNLTGDQVGKGFRLLVKGEIPADKKAGFWDAGIWLATFNDWIFQGDHTTYRVPITCPWPEPATVKWAEERKAFKSGQKIEERSRYLGPDLNPNSPDAHDWSEWEDLDDLSFCLFEQFVRGIEYDYRIKPEPKMVPLCASDVPPGSVFQFMTWTKDEYRTPLEVHHVGVTFIHGGIIESFSWDDLQKDNWRIKRPRQDWQPCCKAE